MPTYRGAMQERLGRGEAALGFGVSSVFTAGLAPLMKHAGYDWLILDREHGTGSLNATSQLCVAAGLCGLTPVVRTTLGSLDEAARALDAGAQGVMAARIETASQSRQVVEACRYPPVGRRGWGAAFAQTGAGSLPDAIAAAEASTVVLAMIESPAGVENAASIAAEPGIDGVFIGALDLSVELGVPGQVRHPAVTGAIEQVAAECRRSSRPFGVGGVGDEDWTRWILGLGAQLLVAGSDQGFMLSAAASRARGLRAIADGTAPDQPPP